LLLVALLLAALVPTQGCTKCAGDLAKKATESAVEKAIEKATGGKADIDVGSSIDLTGFPPELIYPGAKPTGKWSMTTDEGTGATYAFETADPVKTVVDHFKTTLSGWKNTATMESNDAVILSYQTADEKQMAVITVGPKDGGGTTVGVVYSTKK
jgi:hypothetical protein